MITKLKTLKNKLFTPSVLLLLLAFISFPQRILKLVGREDYYRANFGDYFLITKSLVVDHIVPLIGLEAGSPGGFAQGAGWYYLLALPFWLTGGNPYGAKVLMFVVSLLIIFPIVMVFWRYFDKKAAIIIGIFLGISPQLIAYSNSVWPPYVIPLLSVLYLIFLLLFLKKQHFRYFLFMSLSLELMVHFEAASFALLLPSYVLLTLYFLVRKTLKIRDVVTSICVFLLIFLPHIVYDFSHNFYNLRGILDYIFHKTSTSSAVNLHAIFFDRLHVIRETIMLFFPNALLLTHFYFIIFILFGVYRYAKDPKLPKWKKIYLGYILCSILLSSFCLFLYSAEHTPFWWITFIPIFYVVLAGISLGYLWGKSITYNVIICLFLLMFLRSGVDNFLLSAKQEQELKDKPYVIALQEPIEYIYKDSGNQPFKILYVNGGPHVSAFQYLFWYVGKTEYKNSPGLQKLNLGLLGEGGKNEGIDEAKQFEHLEKGLYYVIVISQSKMNNISQSILADPKIGTLITSGVFQNDLRVEKRIIE